MSHRSAPIAAATATAEVSGERVSWAGRVPADGDFDCAVQIRAHADPVPAFARMVGHELVIDPAEPLSGVATGQSAVLYDGTRVIGQFTIARTVSAVPVGA